MADHPVEAGDELRHPPDADDLWNESYYADFVNGDGSWGGWLRLGLYPNRSVAWWTTWIVGTERTGVCSVNYNVPVPAGTGLVATDAATRIELDLVNPLKAFRIAASAPAEAFEWPEDVYSGTPGDETRLEVDLTWTTDGTPYHYELTTRYEIPCNVSGTVTIGDETLTLEGAQGQRDHSWGVRDWWAFGWCWSSARLDDGTRVHLADIRMPGFPVAFGYVQPDPAAVETITSLSVVEQLGEHGFFDTARIEVGTDAGRGLGVTVTPLAVGPVLLRNDDGRTSRFPRAMVRYETDDGRSGLGWIEFNQPEPA
jgi:hypothetical protein